jgi:hypothetical protein
MLKEELDKLKRYAYSSVVVITQDDAILSVGLLEDVIEETKELWNNDVLDSTESVVFRPKNSYHYSSLLEKIGLRNLSPLSI